MKKLSKDFDVVDGATYAVYTLGKAVDKSPVPFYGGLARLVTRPPFNTQTISVRNLSSEIPSGYVDARSVMALLNLEGRSGNLFEVMVGSDKSSARDLLIQIGDYLQTGKL